MRSKATLQKLSRLS
jgi:hypothetical protein